MSTFLEIGLGNAGLAIFLALLAAVASRIGRRPALAHGLWLLVLLKLVTPPLYRVPVPWPSTPKLSTSPGSSSLSEESTVSSWQAAELGRDQPGKLLELSQPNDLASRSSRLVPLESSPDLEQSASSPSRPLDWTELSAWVPPAWVEIVAWSWLASSLLWFAWTGLQVYRFGRLLRFAKRAPQVLQDEVKRLAARLGLTRAPAVWLVPGAVSPMLWSVGRHPRLLFPARLLHQLDRLQRATLFVHELAHYRRRDHWVRLVEVVVLALYWWHPIVWWARRELREAEEQCCDAWVVWTLAGADRAYATALLQTVAFFSRARCRLPAAASGIGQVRHLRRRLTMIMQRNTPRSLSWSGVAAVMVVGLFLLPLLPVVGQQPADSKGQENSKQPDVTDLKIAELKKQLHALEMQKQAEKDKEAIIEKERRDASISKTRKEVAALATEVETKRRELQELEKRHKNALARLAKLEGKSSWSYALTPDGKTYWIESQLAPQQDGKFLFHYSVDNVLDKPDSDYFILSDQAGKGKNWVSKGEFYKSPKSGEKAQHAAGDKSADLEKKLDRLAKELEELRHELRQNREKSGK